MISSVEAIQPAQNDARRVSGVDLSKRAKPSRVAIICDLLEEDWPSMNLVADNLFAHLERDHHQVVAATRIRPSLQRRFARLNPASPYLFNADRFTNRFVDYPRLLRRVRSRFDLFHIIDHSYSQLLHYLPAERTLITCHDLDTFQCLLDPPGARRSIPFQLMTRRILAGFRKAALVITVSAATREQLLGYGLIEPERVVVVPNGVDAVYSPEPNPDADMEAERLLDNQDRRKLDILHVGSSAPRKRIDVLLQVLAGVRKEFPHIRLVRVGGPFTAEQTALIRQHSLAEAILVLPYLEKEVLAAINRRVALVLQPSEREGFGLPVIEAMACATPVLASDIPALREVGGDACAYAPVADVEAWTKGVTDLLNERDGMPDRWARRRLAVIKNASKFSWSKHANQMAVLYRELLA